MNEIQMKIQFGNIENYLKDRSRSDEDALYIALAVRNVLVDHAPLLGYDNYNKIINGKGKDWTVCESLDVEVKKTLLVLLNHFKVIMSTRGMSLDNIMLIVGPLLLNDDPANDETQLFLKSRISPSDYDVKKSSKVDKNMKKKMTRIKQLLESDYESILTTNKPARSVNNDDDEKEATSRIELPLDESNEGISKSDIMSSSTISLQDRSVKVSFPKHHDTSGT